MVRWYLAPLLRFTWVPARFHRVDAAHASAATTSEFYPKKPLGFGAARMFTVYPIKKNHANGGAPADARCTGATG
jgi:hypothetical protein